MALKSSREGLRKELVDYLGNIIIDDNLRNEIVKAVGDKFVTPEVLNENVNNLTMQITTERDERIEGDETLQNRITTEVSVRENADNTLQNNINAETTAREEAVTNLQELIATSGLKMDLLWTNASPSSAFASQNINLDLSPYNFVYLQIKRINTAEDLTTYICTKGAKYLTGGYANHYRMIDIYNEGIYVHEGYDEKGGNDNVITPFRIYGVK